MRADRILAAVFAVVVCTAIVGFSSGTTGASFIASSTNPSSSWNTVNVQPPASQSAPVSAPAGAITLAWTATPTAPNGHTITYLVYRGPVGGPYATQVCATAALTCSDTPPADGTYQYVVQTKIAQGAGFFTSGNSATGTGVSDRTAPTAATAITTAKGLVAGDINLTWTAGTDGGTGVAGYTIRYVKINVCPAASVANYPSSVAVGAVTSTTVSGLVSLSKYCFYLITNDVAGNASANSATAGPQTAK